jgi:hypothetical protein
VSEFDRTVELLDDIVEYLEFITKQYPNDADLGGETRKFTKGLSKIRDKYRNYE